YFFSHFSCVCMKKITKKILNKNRHYQYSKLYQNSRENRFQNDKTGYRYLYIYDNSIHSPFYKLFYIRRLLNDGNMFFVIFPFSLYCSCTASLLIIVHRESNHHHLKMEGFT